MVAHERPGPWRRAGTAARTKKSGRPTSVVPTASVGQQIPSRSHHGQLRSRHAAVGVPIPPRRRIDEDLNAPRRLSVDPRNGRGNRRKPHRYGHLVAERQLGGGCQRRVHHTTHRTTDSPRITSESRHYTPQRPRPNHTHTQNPPRPSAITHIQTHHPPYLGCSNYVCGGVGNRER